MDANPEACAPSPRTDCALGHAPHHPRHGRRAAPDRPPRHAPRFGTDRFWTPRCWPARPTGWHSAAASAGNAFKKPTISCAKRSAAMPGWAGALGHVRRSNRYN